MNNESHTANMIDIWSVVINQFTDIPESRNPILRINSEEVTTGKDYKQNKTDEIYWFMNPKAMSPLLVLRQHAMLKYGPGNHLKINSEENMDRAIRHIYSSFTLPTDKDGTQISELTHAMFRMMMAFEAHVYQLEDKSMYPDYEHIRALYKMYDKEEYDCQMIYMFPMVWRRIGAIFSMVRDHKDAYNINEGTDTVKMCNKIITMTMGRKNKPEVYLLSAAMLYEVIDCLTKDADTSTCLFQDIFFDGETRRLYSELSGDNIVKDGDCNNANDNDIKGE